MRFRIWQVVFFLSTLGLFLYSFTQVDLSLTLSRLSIYQTIERGFQYIGYFQRPLSTQLYIVILAALSACYLFLLRLSIQNKVSAKQLWTALIVTTVLLTFSYNAFSYDLFNNIFDAKIITYYHQSPFIKSALDFPHDPMLSFMHWVQRTYPYGPGWLVLAVPVSFIGLQFFLPTFFLFKMLNAILFLGTVYFIGKIAARISKKESIFVISLFAFNPLVLIECLVSAHNDIAMMFFAVWGLYMLMQKKWIWAIVLIVFSALIKQVTVFMIVPAVLYFVFTLLLKKKFIDFEKFLWLTIVAMIVGLFYVLTQREFQPWYLLWILPFAVLVRQNRFLIALQMGFSLGSLLRYAPFLYLGNWDGIAIPIRWYVLIITPVATTFFVFAQSILYTLIGKSKRA